MSVNSPRSSDAKQKTGRLPPGVANPVDVHVGTRLRLARHMNNLSQETLGSAVGLTFQQIQKYERGSNRIGASRLFQFSEILDVSVGYFFDEMPDAIKSREGAYKTGMSDQSQNTFETDAMNRRETLELVRNYYRIPDPEVRKNVYELAKTLAVSPSDDEDETG